MSPARTLSARSAAAPVAAALLALTAACGGSDGASSQGASGSGPASASTTASTAPLTTSDIGSRLSAALERAGTFGFTLDTTAAGATSTGTGTADVSGSSLRLDSSVEAAGQELQVRVVDGLYYLRSAAIVPGGKWLEIDPKAKSGVGSLLGQLGGATDPTEQLEVLGKATSVTARGTREIAGTRTTRYDVVIPGPALAAGIGFPESLAKELPDSITYVAYVDARDLLRRLDTSLTVRGVKTTTVVGYDDFGEEVSISAPPAAETTTKSSLPGLGG